MSVDIEVADEATDELMAAFQRLLPQLSSTAKPFERGTLEKIVRGEATTLLVARLDGRIAGALTLVTYQLPSGFRARVEDVVVDAAARGRGLGEALSREALRLAAEAGARTVDLTSRPSREAANRLYKRLGFEQRDSSVFRFALDG